MRLLFIFFVNLTCFELMDVTLNGALYHHVFHVLVFV